MPPQRILFVTGRLAEPALRRVVADLQDRHGFEPKFAVLPITVAALMHGRWIQRHLTVPEGVDRVILPGACDADPNELAEAFAVPCEAGPEHLLDLPEYFGGTPRQPPPLDTYDIEILAEINHAPKLSDRELLAAAAAYRDGGADVIDLGCIPGETWTGAGEAARLLVREGFRVSIDSLERFEVEAAVAAGAELVLSCNGHNVDWAAQLPAELVVIPDDAGDARTLDETVAQLEAAGTKYRLDPILEPIGFGFAASLGRYLETRRRYPNAEIMMGVGNLTELSEVDSAGVNLLLAGFCGELGIRSVLTTEVINWARTAVREFDLARRIVHHSLAAGVPPKHLGAQLVSLRDPKLRELGAEHLNGLAAQLTDPNFRIFVERGQIHLLNRDGYWRGEDPYEIFDRMHKECGPLEPSHAFYLGAELAKARTALTLGKQFTQDQALRWGFLTVEEASALERRKREAARQRRGS